MDEARLYWIAGEDTLQGCQKDDCAGTTLTYSEIFDTAAFGADDIYFQPKTSGTSTSIVACPKTGCAETPTTVIANSTFTNNLSGDGDYVYWSTAADIRRCPSTGCGPATEIVTAEATAYTVLSFSGPDAYWVSWAGDGQYGMTNPPPRIRRAPKDGSEPATTVVSDLGGPPGAGFDYPASIAVDAASVYWIGASNHVVSCPVAGCGSEAPTQIVTSNDGKTALQVDASGLYWQESDLSGKSSVYFCPLSGCSTDATITANGVDSFALDDDFIYWTERQNGSFDQGIHRIAKPAP